MLERVTKAWGCRLSQVKKAKSPGETTEASRRPGTPDPLAAKYSQVSLSFAIRVWTRFSRSADSDRPGSGIKSACGACGVGPTQPL